MKHIEDTFQQLRIFLAEYIPCSEEEWRFVQACFHPPQIFDKGDYLCSEGHTCDYLWYQITGLIRFFNVDENGEEQTRHFSFPDILLTSYASFVQRIPSPESIQALETTLVLPLHYQRNQELASQLPQWSVFTEKYVREVYAYLEQRLRDQLGKTAEQRYHDFCQTFPQYAHRIPLQQIASYLGITPQSLSRIRRASLPQEKRRTK
jgi:CRP-like cAMP-binding protein